MSFKEYFFKIICLSHLMIVSSFTIEFPSEGKLKVLYNSLDPNSISQHLAYYELYQGTPLAQQALNDAWSLLTGNNACNINVTKKIPLSLSFIHSLISLVNKSTTDELMTFDQESLDTFEKLSRSLSHSQLKGHYVWSEEEVLQLPLEQIDLARGLLISQFGNDRNRIQSYEAVIDLMALQILARLPKNASDLEKIYAINTYIFEEIGFRFPPHSLLSAAVDSYSFLPSVIDSRKGVCLGVSILYLCIAQRMQLPLEMITPPGHIYVRYRKGDHLINIETTARGIHLDCKHYLSVNTCSLQLRTIREVIGMVHFNQSSIYWQRESYPEVVQSYRKAILYMDNDPLLKELLGYALIIIGEKNEGEYFLKQIQNHKPAHFLTKSSMVEDYFNGKMDAEGFKVIFSKEEEDRNSQLKRKERLENILKNHPYFRAGILSLAMCWMKLHRTGEALNNLERYLQIDKTDPEIYYYYAILNLMRYNYPKAWMGLKQAESLTKMHSYEAEELKDLRRELLRICPEYIETY